MPQDAGDEDTYVPPTVYAPPPGEYQYVQNTDAYDNGAFPGVERSKLGIDYVKVSGSCAKIPSTRPQVDPMDATIVRDPDSADGICWTFRINIRPDDNKGGHQESVSFCARDRALYARAKATTVQRQLWMLDIIGKQEATATTNCPRDSAYLTPTMQPGESWTQTCTGTSDAVKGSFTSTGPLTYVGLAIVNVEGTDETTLQITQDRTVTGAMTGREVTEFYLSMKDAMPLRIHRWTHIDTPTGFPCITNAIYDNYGSDWLLKSRTPKGGLDAGGASGSSP